MAATYTEVTLEEMETFLKRAYRALKPKRGDTRGEVFYDLNLSKDNILIRVWTSIGSRSGHGAGVGADAIRVNLITKGGKPLMPKSKIVKRTQGWKGSLQDRIEDLLEIYESKTGYWKEKQQQRDEAPKEPVSPAPALPTPSGVLHTGTFTRLSNGDWGARLTSSGASPGDKALLTTKSMKKVPVVLERRFWQGPGVEMWTIAATRKNATENDEGYDEIADRVAQRTLFEN